MEVKNLDRLSELPATTKMATARRIVLTLFRFFNIVDEDADDEVADVDDYTLRLLSRSQHWVTHRSHSLIHSIGRSFDDRQLRRSHCPYYQQRNA